jgi:competence protein ComEC
MALQQQPLYNLPLLGLLIPLIAGILLEPLLPESITGIFLISGCLFFFSAAFILHQRSSFGRNTYWLRFGLLLASILFLGTTSGHFQNIQRHKTWYGHYLPEAQLLKAKITESPQKKDHTLAIPVAVTALSTPSGWKKVKGNFKLYIYLSDSLPPYRQGDFLLLPPKLIFLKKPQQPFVFDYSAYAARNGIFHQAFLSKEEVLRIPSITSTPGFSQAIRTQLLNSIQTHIADSTTRALVEATLLNERAMLDDTLWEAYSVTGIVHIIAISGMHVTILFGLLLFTLRWWRNKQFLWIKYLVALPLIWIYVSITDFPPSAIRAAIMFTLIALGIMLNRNAQPVNTWAGAGLIMLCYNPYWLYNIGVQLSFLAVLSILIFYEPIRRLLQPPNKGLQIIWEVIAVSLAAQILVCPLVIYYFHQFPAWVLLANIPAALYSVLLMTGALLLFILDSLGLPCLWLGTCLTAITQVFHYLILHLAAITPESLRRLFIDFGDYWMMMALVVLVSLAAFRKKAIFLIGGLTTGCLLLVSFILQDIKALRQERLMVYPVSRYSLIDHYKGKQVYPYGTSQEQVPDKIKTYHLEPSRLGYRSKVIDVTKDNAGIWKIGQYSILQLTRQMKITGTVPFPVDYLVLGKDCLYDPIVWQTIFQPRQIILDGSLPRWKAIQWKAKLETMGLSVHWVLENGAWSVAPIR